MQDFTGVWLYSLELIKLIGLEAINAAQFIPDELKSMDIWMTLIVIRYLELNFSSKKSVWKLVVNKA